MATLIKGPCPDGAAGEAWIFDCNYHTRMPAKNAKFRWHPESKTWWTNVIERAALLANYGDEETKPHLLDYISKTADAVAASRALDADFDVPCPAGQEYLPFQRAGIKYCLSTASGNALIGDDMGLGKTIEALGVINMDSDIRTVIVVCPATVKRNWQREAKLWLVRPSVIPIWEGRMDVLPADPPDGGVAVHIINWDIIVNPDLA